MPNIWTHILFSEEVTDAISNPNSFLKNEEYIKLGAQGPDPFFYYNFWPWVKNEPVHEIGMLLHQKNCGPFLIDLIAAAKTMDQRVRAYVFGFITHHILDRNTHPFIHYYAGFSGNNHQKLEIIIDTLMMQKHNLKTWKTPVYKEIDIGFSFNKEIAELLHKTVKRHYPEVEQNDSRYIQKAYRDMKLALKILFDPNGWKNKIFNSYVSPYSHQPVNDQVDYLNAHKNVWHHPATKEPSTKSFIELFEQARSEGIEIMSEVLAYWKGEETEPGNHLKTLIGNISYDTGLPIESNLENKYSEPIIV